jgi:exo-1,4-beta-D-glucosaminidase
MARIRLSGIRLGSVLAVLSALILVTVPAGASAAPTAKTATASATPANPAALANPAGLTSAGTGQSAVSPADTGASNVADLGSGGWRVQSSAAATQSGTQISTPGFDAGSWLPVANDDGGAPGTEVEALASNGRCPGDPGLQPVNLRSDSTRSVFYSTNMKACYGQMTSVGADTLPQFKVPWWWRTDFSAGPGSGGLSPGQRARLIVNGVIGAADVWVNGHQVATSATVTGAYTKFSFDITGLIHPGTNSLAVEVQPNDPNTMFTLDDVDWNQIPPDNNTGIQFPVQVETDGPLSDGNAHVTEDNAPGLSSSRLTVQCDVTNNTRAAQTGMATATVTPPADGGGPVTVSQQVTVPAGTTQTVTFAPAKYPSLDIAHPSVWWPYQLGPHPLYRLSTSVSQNGSTLNSTHETFGIRTVTSYLTGKSAAAPSGARQFAVNGVPIVIRGGGFSPDLFLHYSAAGITRQLTLMRGMGINALRLEGHIMPPGFFEQMDAAGMLINAGYQCCDAWELQGSGLTSPADYQIMKLSALTIGQSLRDHPSVFSFQWSDQPPLAKQESVTLDALHQAGFTDPVISSAEYNSSPQLGPSGEKEGPYDWVPPDYWYDTTHYDPTDPSRTNAGGAWAFDSEQSSGDTVPTLDSIQRFMSPAEQAALWQDPGNNQYHLNYEPQCQAGYSFGTLCHFDAALSSRYGSWSSLSQYVQLAQAQDYENTRAQYEAFIDHSTSSPVPSTGTVYWQVNKGWPSLLWNLYNSDGDQAGSYFGAQEGNRALHALYALDTGTVTVDNLGGARQSGLSVESRVYSAGGPLLDDQTASGIALASQQVHGNVLHPRVPAATKPPSKPQVYFVELLLRRGGTVVDRNVYWLSTQPDEVNWDKTLGQPQAVMSQYAGLQALRSLPRSTVSVRASTAPAPDGKAATTVTITNTAPTSSGPAFLLRADIHRGTAAGQPLPSGSELQSATWDGNDITLWPGESQTLTVTYRAADLHGATPVITLSGWNVPATAGFPAAR